MNTLRELGEFVGIPQGSLEVRQFGGPPVISLGNVSALVMNGKRKVPMRAVIQALQNLTPITLEAEIIGSRSGEEPFIVVVRFNAGGGITWFTHVNISLGGKGLLGIDDPSNSAGDFESPSLGPGEYQFVATRAGISNKGFVSLSDPLGTISVSPSPPPPPPPITPPSISVQSNGDRSFKVSGSGFVPKDARVNILVGDSTLNQEPLNFVVTATNGAFKDFPTGKICQRQGEISFEASDGRIQGRQVFSNTVKISCPF